MTQLVLVFCLNQIMLAVQYTSTCHMLDIRLQSLLLVYKKRYWLMERCPTIAMAFLSGFPV